MKLVGISGTNGAGKDTVAKILVENYGFYFVSGSDILRKELQKQGLPVSRNYTSKLSAEWRRTGGLAIIINKAVNEYKKVSTRYRGLTIASLRHPAEADRIHELGGIVLWVDAEPNIRYKRLQENRAERGSHRASDDNKTFEQFMSDEQAEMYPSGDFATLNTAAVKAKSDFFIENETSTLKDLEAEINKTIGSYLKSLS